MNVTQNKKSVDLFVSLVVPILGLMVVRSLITNYYSNDLDFSGKLGCCFDFSGKQRSNKLFHIFSPSSVVIIQCRIVAADLRSTSLPLYLRLRAVTKDSDELV